MLRFAGKIVLIVFVCVRGSLTFYRNKEEITYFQTSRLQSGKFFWRKSLELDEIMQIFDCTPR